MTKNELSKIPKEIKAYITGLKKREMDYYSIPEEYKNHPLIVKFERELGIRKSVKKGFDVIRNIFFVEEVMTISALYGVERERIEKTYFEDFESYFSFLAGDIYENACYFQYEFTQEEMNKFNLDINKINSHSLIQFTQSDFSLEYSKNELWEYKEIEKEKKYRKKWIDKFNACNNYQEFIKVISSFNRSKYYGELDFFFYSFLSSSNKHAFDIMMEYISSHYAYGIEKALCFDYKPRDVLSAFIQHGGTEKHIQEFENYVALFEKKELCCYSRSYFDEKNHFYYYRILGYVGDNKFPIVKHYKIFDCFEDLANYLDGNIAYCDLSKAIIPNVDFSQYKIGEYVKLPVDYYSDLIYTCNKFYDRYKKLFVVEQLWKDTQEQIIRMHSHKFEYFFDFVYFCGNDLSNADLLFCDGLLNLRDFSQINFNNAKLKSQILDTLSVPYAISKYCEATTQSFSLVCQNEENSNTALIAQRDSFEFGGEANNQKIFYISDLHLLHRIKNAACKNDNDVFYTLQTIIDNLLHEVKVRGSILLFGGDISSNFNLYCLFVKTLRESIDREKLDAKAIFVLGNHELWEFPNCTFDSIVEKYKAVLAENNMLLLQNNIFYKGDDNEIRSIATEEILKNQRSEIREKMIRARIVLFGGLAFSGYYEKFNANHGIYRNTINRAEEIEQTKFFEQLYNIVCEYLYDKKVIVLTHTPLQNWSKKETPHKEFIYVNGHTHKNYYFDDGDYRIYADNQIGYHSHYFTFKFFYHENDYDIFSEYADGIYEINREQYINFYRGKNITMTFNREIYKLYMLKKNGYYCFVLQFPSGSLSILNGGALKGLKKRDIQYYYEKMDDVIECLTQPFSKYTNFQKKVAKEVKAFGGDGYIHGCIIDIDFENHLYVNPYDLSITPYWAASIVYKQVFPSTEKLLKNKCPSLYANYMKMLNGESETGLMIIADSKIKKNSAQIYLDTDIYKASREIKKMQKLSSNILSIWIESPQLLLGNNKK